ncbi:MAG: hypothetical protein PHE89_03110 [Alphaproteobacteria bacterium]|nr:hypothetical protein [Alphaproteobacteria bacterium]
MKRFFISLFVLCLFTATTHAKTAKNDIELTFGIHNDFDRFVFKYPENKPNYQITTLNNSTSIVFDGEFDIKSRDLINYPRHKFIRNELLDNGQTRFIIPAGKLKSFEMNDEKKIVIDVQSHQRFEKTPPTTSFVINEIKVIEKKPQQITEAKETIESSQEIEQKPALSTEQEVTTEPISHENLDVKIESYENGRSDNNALIGFLGNKNRKSVSLSFSWSDRVSMAAFVKNDYLWLAFDKAKSINTQEIADLTKGFLYDIVQLPHPTATVLRLKLRENIYPSVRKEGLLWVVDLFNQEIKPKIRNLEMQISYAAKNHAYLFVPTNNAGDVIMTFDPETGDILMMAPIFMPYIGVSKAYRYPEFDVLRSLQGFVVEPFADDILLTRNNSGLTIKAIDRGLNVSPNIDLLKKQTSLLQQKDWIKKLADDLPIGLTYENYLTTTAELMDKITRASEEEKNARRLELAKFYNAKGLGTEAMGILQEIIKSDSKFAAREDVHGQLGIAYFLTQRYEDAIQEFSFGKLSELNEAHFWKTLCLAALEPDAKQHNKLIASFTPVIREYPDELRLHVAMIGVEAAVTAGDDVTAQTFIDIIQSLNTKRKIGAFLDYWSFEILSIQGYSQTAMLRLKSATLSTSSKYSAYARKKLIMLDYKSGKATKLEAINELERLKYVWGERSFRISLLEDLYDIYISTGDYYNALENMKSLRALYPDDQKDRLTLQMVSIFENIFINNNAGNLTPIQALALFNDFEWLTPQSEYYNQIIINLSDRLVSVDLLARADNLLRKYVGDKNIPVQDRALIGARLALINIFNGQYNDALRFLDMTQDDSLSELISSQRRIIRAKALIGTEKYNEAIELLEADKSHNAEVIKTDLYWRTGQWSLAADGLKKLITLPKEGEKMTDGQASTIIDWVTALRKAKKDSVVVLARHKFLPYFKESKYYSAFNILTNSVEENEIDIKNLNNFIKDVDKFRDFARTYNEALGSNSYIEAGTETK